MAHDAWISVSTIKYGNVLAFNKGEIIPDSHVSHYGLDTLGLVARITVADDGTSSDVGGTDPVTQRELDAALDSMGSTWSLQSVPGERGLPRRMSNPPTFGYRNAWIDQPSAIPGAVPVPAVLTPDREQGQTPALNTASFAFRGGPWEQKGHAYPDMFFTHPQSLAGEFPNYPFIEFLYYGQSFEFGYKAQGWMATRVWVDGELAEDVHEDPDPADGNAHFRQVTFAAPGWRHIRLDVAPDGFFGVFASPSDTVVAVPPLGRRLMVIGDSFAEGTGAAFMSGYPVLLGAMLGFQEVIGLAQGSTGLVSNGAVDLGRTRYINRSESWKTAGATHVLVQFSGNDNYATDADLAAAVRELIPVLKALPGSPEVWFVGHWANNGTGAVELSIHRDSVVRPIVEAAGLLFISQVEPQGIWTGDGHVGNPQGGTCDVLVGADGTHPTQAGHEGIARSLFVRLLASLA